MKRIVLAISGASGVCYGMRLLEVALYYLRKLSVIDRPRFLLIKMIYVE